MRIFSSETAHDYGTYTFAYAPYAEHEPGDSLGDIYGLGYLPYSGSPDAKNVFYMARSARVALSGFELSSENRRIAKKFDGILKKERIALRDFEITDKFLKFCLNYFTEKHGAKAMPRERLEHILNSGLVSTIAAYYNNSIPVGYVFEVSDMNAGHYWFSFYDLALARDSFGLWLMLDLVRDAKNRGLKHYYLGTVYGEKALYKTNFKPLEWWNGEKWNKDVKALKELARDDAKRTTSVIDIWKDGKKKCF